MNIQLENYFPNLYNEVVTILGVEVCFMYVAEGEPVFILILLVTCTGILCPVTLMDGNYLWLLILLCFLKWFIFYIPFPANPHLLWFHNLSSIPRTGGLLRVSPIIHEAGLRHLFTPHKTVSQLNEVSIHIEWGILSLCIKVRTHLLSESHLCPLY